MLPLINCALGWEWLEVKLVWRHCICFYSQKADLRFPRIQQSINLAVNLCTCSVWGKAFGGKLSTPRGFEVLFHLWERHRRILREVFPASKHKIYVWITLNAMQMILPEGCSEGQKCALRWRMLQVRTGSQMWILETTKGLKGQWGTVFVLQIISIIYS